MIALIRRLHMYAGLLVFSHLAVYGIAGLVATLRPGLERPKQAYAVRYVPFTRPAAATDKQVAELVYRALRPHLTRPVPDWFLQHTPDHHLLLDYYNINGIYRVVVLENERRLRVENIRNSAWLFLEDIHAATPADQEAPTPVRLWAWWNEAAMWTLLGFCITGMWIWLATRPRYRWAWAALAGSAASFTILWFVFR